ncbi:hypothetical protein FB45DRAFT_1022468 [Roridomyces roridus]|uniref:F-box domain-containing protein n=1 Tax=Roridomyces roridus TaxID=1738132 RepID=A0AAD7FTC7_9AGAR|nr:hypothetical protein FB45DRAFT_1022468 [Roridomyces roridus]
MSIQALQAQIDQVSADIERQKELLEKLERSKKVLEHQLNNMRDPFVKLPLEISSDIFVRCIPATHPGPGSVFPRLFLKICNTWTAIALSTPALWARISFHLPRPPGFTQLLRLWFQRAGGHPMHISITGPVDDVVASILWEHSSHLGRLEFLAGEVPKNGEDKGAGRRHVELWDIWGSARPQSLPLLQSLRIHGHEHVALRSLPFLRLLRRSSNLSELILHDVEFDDRAYDVLPEEVVLPSLRRLMFDYEVSPSLDQYDILPFISAPHLQVFGLNGEAAFYDGLRVEPFLKESNPPLQELILRNAGNADDLYCLLALVPTVTRLELKSPSLGFVEELFIHLAENPEKVLPSLQAFDSVCLVQHRSTAFLLETTLRLLTARRTQLRTFHFTFYSQVQIPANTLAGFKELSAEGLDIQLGHPDWISLRL